MWIKLDATGVAFPQFLEVQDHIWGYGLMFSGLFIAITIWKFGYQTWRRNVEEGTAEPGLAGYLSVGVPAFREEFINTGDNDIHVGKWWDMSLYIFFPIGFTILIVSYFADMIRNTPDVWSLSNPYGLTIILVFWGVVASIFIGFNKLLTSLPLYRNVPEGADCDITMLPGGDDDLVSLASEKDSGSEMDTIFEAEIVEATA